MDLSQEVIATGVKTFVMEVSRIRALRGPNLWSRHTAIQAIVTCEGAECRHCRPARFRSPPARALPGTGRPDPADHLDTVSMAHALEFAALGLQAQAGCPVTFSRTAQTSNPASIRWSSNTPKKTSAGWPSNSPNACQAAAQRHALRPRPGADLRELDEDERLGPSPAPSSMPPWHAASPIAA
jgi:cyanophycin synthetase